MKMRYNVVFYAFITRDNEFQGMNYKKMNLNARKLQIEMLISGSIGNGLFSTFSCRFV